MDATSGALVLNAGRDAFKFRGIVLGWARCLKRSGVDLAHHLVGDFEVGVDVLHVVVILKVVDELEHLGGLFGVEGHGVLRQIFRLGLGDFERGLFQGAGDLVDLGRDPRSLAYEADARSLRRK